MLAASPVLRAPEPPASNENALHASARYGSHPTSTQFPNRQSALLSNTAAGMTSQSPSGRIVQPSSYSHSSQSQSHEGVSTQAGRTAFGGQAAISAFAGQPFGADTSSSDATHQGTELKSSSSAGLKKPEVPQTYAHSPSIKRRQPASPSTDESAITKSAAPSLPLKRAKTERKNLKLLPLQYELCDVEDIVVLIADMIAELIQTNDNLPLQDGVLTRFHSRTPPGISVIDYLQRLAKHAALTPPLLLSMVYYIDLLCGTYASFTVTTLTVHRFLITAATVAAKGLSDSFWNNSTYARVGGIKIAELGLLELDFLHRVDWRIVPTPERLVAYYVALVSRSDKYELGGQRNDNPAAADKVDDAGETFRNDAVPSAGDENGLETVKTEKKWEKWMKDVADDAGN